MRSLLSFVAGITQTIVGALAAIFVGALLLAVFIILLPPAFLIFCIVFAFVVFILAIERLKDVWNNPYDY